MNRETSPENLKLPKDSKFGQKEKIREMMQTGEIVELGPIQDLIPNIPDHSNEVNLVELGANELQYVKLQTKDGILYGVFKPLEGEDHDSQGAPAFYTREKIVEVIDDFLEFDLVPPTVIREVNGRLGSLQLFISHETYTNVSSSPFSEEESLGDDYYKIALIDYITLQSDRKPDNFLVNLHDPQDLVLIDNADTFEDEEYEYGALGPQAELTSEPNPDYIKCKTPQMLPKTVQIPEKYLTILSEKLNHKEELNQKLRQITRSHVWDQGELLKLDEPVPDLNEEQIAQMWQRVEELVKYGVFISSDNRDLVTTGVAGTGISGLLNSKR
jgi:hypothetical protein